MANIKVEAEAFGIPINKYLLEKIQVSYAQVLRHLMKNPDALKWIKSYFKLEAKDYLTQTIQIPPKGVSTGLVSFYKYMTGLQTLTKERLLMPTEHEEWRVRQLKSLWTREKYLLKQLDQLQVNVGICK